MSGYAPARQKHRFAKKHFFAYGLQLSCLQLRLKKVFQVVTTTEVFAFEGLNHDSGCEKWYGIGLKARF